MLLTELSKYRLPLYSQFSTNSPWNILQSSDNISFMPKLEVFKVLLFISLKPFFFFFLAWEVIDFISIFFGPLMNLLGWQNGVNHTAFKSWASCFRRSPLTLLTALAESVGWQWQELGGGICSGKWLCLNRNKLNIICVKIQFIFWTIHLLINGIQIYAYNSWQVKNIKNPQTEEY